MRIVLAILLMTYFVLNQAGLADSSTAFWSPTAAVVAAAVVLVRAARSSAASIPEPMQRSKLTRRVLTLTVLTYLSVSLVSGLVSGFVPTVSPGDSPDHAIAVALRLSTTIQLPISLVIIFGVGRLSSRWLTVTRPFRWLAAISVIPALVSSALHPVAVTFARNFGSTPPRDLVEIAPRMVAVTVLIFCALALGNLSGRTPQKRIAATITPGGENGTEPTRDPAITFLVALRGYDMAAVDRLIHQATDALASTDSFEREKVRAALQNPAMPIALRGYDRSQVDNHLRQLANGLESGPPTASS